MNIYVGAKTVILEAANLSNANVYADKAQMLFRISEGVIHMIQDHDAAMKSMREDYSDEIRQLRKDNMHKSNMIEDLSDQIESLRNELAMIRASAEAGRAADAGARPTED